LEKVIESGNKAIFYCERILSLNDNPKEIYFATLRLLLLIFQGKICMGCCFKGQ